MNNKIFLFILISVLIFGVAAQTEIGSYIESFVEDQGVLKGSVQNVTEVNKTDLPSSISISNVEDNNVGIYDIKYFDGTSNKSLYVISFASQTIESSPIRQGIGYNYLTFKGSSDYIGKYLLLDSGSIVGLSSIARFSGTGSVSVEVYVNSELMFISNDIYSGKEIDYDTQSDGIDKFNAGDIISVKVVPTGDVNMEEVSSIVKIG